MARVILDNEREELKKFNRAWSSYTDARKSALARARAIADAEVSALLVEAARAAHRARAKGTTKKQLGIIMHTSDYGTIQKLLDSVEAVVTFDAAVDAATGVRASDEFAEGQIRLVEISDNVFELTLAGDELELAKTRAEWTRTKLLPATCATATVQRLNATSGTIWSALTDAWVVDAGEQHPVVAWLSIPTSQQKLTDALSALEGN